MTLKGPSKNTRRQRSQNMGFSLLELLVVVLIGLVLAGIAIPQLMTAMHSARLKGSVSDFSSLLQTGRMKAEVDDRYYSIYVLTGQPREGFVDIYPQNANGTSGGGGTVATTKDPSIFINNEIVLSPAASAPNTTNLQTQMLPAASSVVPQDGTVATTPITFGPRGLPCKALAGVCDSLGGPQAYWIFFQNNISQNWGAVTVTPGGRIQRWLYTGGGAGTWSKY